MIKKIEFHKDKDKMKINDSRKKDMEKVNDIRSLKSLNLTEPHSRIDNVIHGYNTIFCYVEVV